MKEKKGVKNRKYLMSLMLLIVLVLFPNISALSHVADEVFFSPGGNNVNFQEAMNHDYFDLTTGYTLSWTLQGIQNTNHASGEIFISVNGINTNLRTAIENHNLCSNSAGTYTGSVLFGHKGEDIIVTYGGRSYTLQALINMGFFCDTPIVIPVNTSENAPCYLNPIYNTFECSPIKAGGEVNSGTTVTCTFSQGTPGIVSYGSEEDSFISVDRTATGTCFNGNLTMPLKCRVPTNSQLDSIGLTKWTCSNPGSYVESTHCSYKVDGNEIFAFDNTCTQFGFQSLNPILFAINLSSEHCQIPWTSGWSCIPGDSTFVTVNESAECQINAADGTRIKIGGDCVSEETWNNIESYCQLPFDTTGIWDCNYPLDGSWIKDETLMNCQMNVEPAYYNEPYIVTSQKFENIACKANELNGFNYPRAQCRGLTNSDLVNILGSSDASKWVCETGFREFMTCTYTPTGEQFIFSCTSGGWAGSFDISTCSSNSDCEANQVCNSEYKYCECANNYQDCDGNKQNGCEIDIRTDPSNCGSCGTTCTQNSIASSCADKQCSCHLPDGAGWLCTGGYYLGGFLPLGETTTCTSAPDYLRLTGTCLTNSFPITTQCQVPVLGGDWSCTSTQGSWLDLSASVSCRYLPTGMLYTVTCTNTGWA